MEGKLSSCGGLVNTQPGARPPPVRWGEDQMDKSEKKGVGWDKVSLVSEEKLYKQAKRDKEFSHHFASAGMCWAIPREARRGYLGRQTP